MTNTKVRRTKPQNSSLHSSLDLYAEKLNSAGYDYIDFASAAKLKGFSVPWTKVNLKEIFNIIANAMYAKSSSELTTIEMGECWRVFEHKMSEQSGIGCVWRSRL